MSSVTSFVTGYPYQSEFDRMSPGRDHDDFFCGLERRVLIASNVPARDPRFEHSLDFGRAFTEELFRSREGLPVLNTGGSPAFICFPERHLSAHERRALFTALARCDRDFSRVDVITSDSVLIAQASCSTSIDSDRDYYHDYVDRHRWWFNKLSD